MTLALIAALVGLSQAGDVVLWDNDLRANGVSGMAVSGPRFPTTRVADDFIVPDGQRWHIKRFTYVGATFNPEGAGWHHAFELRGYEEPTVPVTLIQVLRGQRVSGATIAMARSDDDRYVISARRPTAVGQPFVEVIVEGRATAGDVTWTSFTLESKATAGPVRQQIELWRFDTNNWHLMHERMAIADDFFSFRRLRARQNESPGRYVSANGTVRARLTWYDLGVASVGWTVQINQAGWHVVPN